VQSPLINVYEAMKKRQIAIILFLIALSVGIFRMRNFFRFAFVQQHRPVEVKLNQIEYYDEGAFEVYIYSANRTWCSRRVSWINAMFNDELILFKIPISSMRFENVTEAPIGKDSKVKFDCWFNTQYFMEDFQPCDGWKDKKVVLGFSRFDHNTLVINSNEEPHISTSAARNPSDQLFECRYTHRPGRKQSLNMDNLNYRSYLAVNSDYVYYAVGYGNSLISCSDANALMQLHGIGEWIITDGGTSIDYCFKGRHKTYQFSSVPFRSIFSKWNSPYYLGAKAR
jgi:hypothetical protein